MQKIGYIDLHCDSLTARENFEEERAHVNLEKLKRAGAAAQCFAIYTDGKSAAEDFSRALARYKTLLKKNGESLSPVLCYDDFIEARKQGKIGAILTVENLGFIGGDVKRIDELKKSGVVMCSLVWNNANLFAYPNLVWKGEAPDFAARNARGLTKLGKEAVEKLNENRIIADVSHLSDGGVKDVLALSKFPVVASHSNAAAVCGVSRNLRDGQIKKIADKGGVIGVNFCKDFLGQGEVFESVLNHIAHIVNVGGEDCIALGSDFDGIPTVDGLEDCTKVPILFEYLCARLSYKVVEKLAFSNFLRVLREIS